MTLSEKQWTAHLVDSIERGVPVDPSSNGHSAAPGRLAQIPARAIRAAILHKGLTADPHGLVIQRAEIAGTLNLEFASVDFPLAFLGCQLTDEANLTGAHLRALVLTDSHVPGIRLDRIKIDHMLALDGSFVSDEVVSAPGAALGGDLVLDGAHLATSSSAGLALDLEGAHIGQSLFLRDGFGADGTLNMLEARIGGQLVLRGACLRAPDGDALVMDGAFVGRGVFITDQSHCYGSLRLVGTHIEAQLNIRDSHLINPSRNALALDYATVSMGVFLERLEVEGSIEGKTSRIGGFRASASSIRCDNLDAIWLDGATINGDLDLGSLRVIGQVRLLGVRVDGQLVLNGTRITGSRDFAISLDGARVAEDLTFDSGFVADGEVRMRGGSIGATLSLRNARLQSSAGDSLTLDRTRVHGDLLMDGDFRAEGGVSLQSVDVEGRMVLAAAQLGPIVSLRLARIGHLDLATTAARGTSEALTPLDLAGVSVGTLSTPVLGTPPPIASAVSWQVATIEGAVGTDRRRAEEWLRTDSDGSPQPWQVVADVFENAGRESDARWIRHRAAKLTNARRPLGARLVGYAYNALAGHGYYPLRAAGALIAVAVLAFALAQIDRGAFQPTDWTIAAVEEASDPEEPGPPGVSGSTPCAQLGGYPCFDPWLYAAQTALPVAGTSQLDAWQVSSPAWVAAALLSLRVAAWVLAAMLLAGLAGLLKKT